MKTTNNRPVRLAGLTCVLGLLLAQAIADNSLPDWKKKPPFDPTEAQRYKTSISPVTPDSGIMTGYVVVNGYYLLPPYEVTSRNDSIFVNGVRIHPAQSPSTGLADSGKMRALISSEGYAVTMQLQNVAANALEVYRTVLAHGDDTTHALAVAESLMKADSLVHRVGRSPVNRFRYVLHGPVTHWPSGLRYEAQYSVLFPHALGARSLRGIDEDSACDVRARLLRDLLRRGDAIVYSGESQRATTAGYLLPVVRAMLAPDLNQKQRWQTLLRYCAPDEAYYDVVNLDRSRTAWQALARRLGGAR
jgi:hypothetical protein